MRYLQTIDRLLMMHARAAGHTTAAIKVAKEVNGTLVVSDQNHKQFVMRQAMELNAWPIATVSLDEFTDFGETFRAFGQPIILDHHALEIIVGDMRRHVDMLNEQIKALRDSNDRLLMSSAVVRGPETKSKRRRKK